jgi:RNA polymerase sigma-70 factor (ECF subfamily)
MERTLMPTTSSNVLPFTRGIAAGDAGEESRGFAADADAMDRLSRGEIGALGEIYDRHHAAVRRFIAHATASTHDADDLVHTTFLLVPKIAPSFDRSRSCRAWLLGVAARVVRRHRTAGTRFTRALLRWRQTEPRWVNDPAKTLDARAGLEQVAKALRDLSEKNRVVLIMADVEGLRCEEIAAALEVPIGTVWRRLHDARNRLLALVPEATR